MFVRVLAAVLDCRWQSWQRMRRWCRSRRYLRLEAKPESPRCRSESSHCQMGTLCQTPAATIRHRRLEAAAMWCNRLYS